MTESTDAERPVGDTGADSSGSVARTLRGSGSNLVGSVVSAVAGFGVFWLISRRYDETGAGILFGVASLITFVANASKLGAEVGAVFGISRVDPATEPAQAARISRTAVVAPLWVSTLLGVGALVFATPIAEVLTSADQVDRYARVLVASAVALPAMCVGQVLLGLSRGHGTMGPTVRWFQIIRPVGQLLLTAIVVGVGLTLGWAALAWTVPVVIMALGATRWVLRHTPGLVSVRGRAEGFWRYSAPRGVSDVAHGGLEKLDIVLVGALATPAAAGLYIAANRLVNFGQMATFAFGQAAAPELSKLMSTEDRSGARAVVQSVATVSITLVWPAFIQLCLFAAPVLTVFGDGFGDGADALVILSIGLITVVGLGPGDVLVLMSGRSGVSLANHLVALGVNVAIDIALIPDHGAVGAAIGWTVAIVLMRVLSVVQMAITENVYSFGARSGAAAGLALVCHLGLGLAVRSHLGSTLGALVVSTMLAGVVHAALCWGLRRPLGLDVLGGLIRR